MSNENETAPRVLTQEEVREKFIRHVWELIRYWSSEDRQPSIDGKLSGLAFSILVMIDGGSAGLCSFSLCPSPHADDKEYHRERGENWWPTDEDRVDIGGSLHELFYKYEPKK